MGLTPVETRNFKWDLDATFASNKQTVEELAEGLDEYTLTSGLSGLQIKAAKGDSFGLYGTAWKRDDQGNYVINSKTGLREKQSITYVWETFILTLQWVSTIHLLIKG